MRKRKVSDRSKKDRYNERYCKAKKSFTKHIQVSTFEREGNMERLKDKREREKVRDERRDERR